MNALLDIAREYVERKIPENFLINYTPKYFSDGFPLMALSPMGWALHNLGNTIEDKESSAMKIALGIAAFKQPDLVDIGEVNSYEFINAYHLLKDIRLTGETDKLIGIDAVASGVQLIGAGTLSAKTLITCLGEPKKSIEEAFYATIQNTYRQVYNQGIKNIPEDQREEYVKILVYEDVKAGIIPTLYGSKNSLKKMFGDSPILLNALENALTMKIPGIRAHSENFMSLTFEGKDVKYIDYLGRHIHLERLEQVGYSVSTSRGEVLLKVLETTSVKNSFYPDTFLPLQAHSIHGQDSVFPALMTQLAAAEGVSFFDVHDCYHAPVTFMNEIRALYRYTLLDIAEKEDLKRIYTQLGGDPNQYIQGDKEAALNVIKNSHSFII